MRTNYRVIVGPYRLAKRYAAQRNWPEDEVVIVTRGHQLKTLNPAQILQIVWVRVTALGQRIVEEIIDETDQITNLWPVRIQVAA